MEIEMKIRGLMMDPITNMPIVILKEAGGSGILPIWVGVYEANAIALEIEKVVTPRPMTHDLLKNLLVGHQVLVPVTKGKLDLGPWQQVYYAEFDGARPKRVLIKIIGD